MERYRVAGKCSLILCNSFSLSNVVSFTSFLAAYFMKETCLQVLANTIRDGSTPSEIMVSISTWNHLHRAKWRPCNRIWIFDRNFRRGITAWICWQLGRTTTLNPTYQANLTISFTRVDDLHALVYLFPMFITNFKLCSGEPWCND